MAEGVVLNRGAAAIFFLFWACAFLHNRLNYGRLFSKLVYNWCCFRLTMCALSLMLSLLLGVCSAWVVAKGVFRYESFVYVGVSSVGVRFGGCAVVRAVVRGGSVGRLV